MSAVHKQGHFTAVPGLLPVPAARQGKSRSLRSRLVSKLDLLCFNYLMARNIRGREQQLALVPRLDFLAAQYLQDEDIQDTDRLILERVRPYTLVNTLGIHALLQATEYVVRRKIPGDFIECGSYRGGCGMAVALKLLALGDTSRSIFLCDTFTGAPMPERAEDVNYFRGVSAQNIWRQARRVPGIGKAWFKDVYQEAHDNVAGTGYPESRIHLVKGLVEETLPALPAVPIAILRLDTDWYESTRFELEQLYGRVSTGGVLIVDDYGTLSGSKDATDEFFARPDIFPTLLHRTNYTVRQAIKI